MTETMTTETPQCMVALELANTVRLRRAAVKRSINAGIVTPAGILADPPPELENMTIAELLAARRRWGRKRTMKFLRHLAIGENRTIGQLTERQRVLLIGEMREAGA